MFRSGFTTIAVCLFAILSSFGPLSFAGVDEQRLINADKDSENWLSYSRTYAEDRESPLTQITPENVSELGLAWSFDTGTRRGLEASPLVVDGVIYSTGSWSKVFANNAVTGELLWAFDPEVPRAWAVNACCDAVNRGVAVYKESIFVGTLDGRLIALNRSTGEVRWSTLTIDKTKPYTITGAPRVVHDTVVIGNGGAEYGVRGYVSAFDTATGEQRWRFYTVPGDPNLPPESEAMAMAAKTWSGDVYYKMGGGGTVWDSMAYDPALDLLYIGVGNGAPWNRNIRSPGGGDNLFLSSVVALNASTGEYVWHYQTTPADTWDYTATQHMMLLDVEIDGKPRKTLMQAPKNGFFYVLDRVTGELISAETYTPITWASHVDMATGRPVETQNADHSDEFRITHPAPSGGHNWQPMAYNSALGLMYIPMMESLSIYSTPDDFTFVQGGHWNLAQGFEAEFSEMSVGVDPAMVRAISRRFMRGNLLAWDPIKQQEVWRVPHATVWNGGLLSTKSGLVFQGNGTGEFVAYRADNGKRLWQIDTDAGIIAAPISYAVNGEQYIAVMAGWGGALGLVFPEPAARGGGPGRLLVYKLGGKAQLPARDIVKPKLQPPARVGSDESIANGAGLYTLHCTRCHGMNVESGGSIRDLRHMNEATHDLFDDIVLGGIFSPLGMVSFADVLSEQEAHDIQNYVISVANDELEAEQTAPWWRDSKLWIYEGLATALNWFI